MRRDSKFKDTLQACLKNRSFMTGFVILFTIILMAIFAEQIAPYEYTAQNPAVKMSAPCK